MPLRLQLLLAIAGTAITTALVVAWLSYGHAVGLVEEAAIRTVGAVAASREQMVVLLLRRQLTRATALADDLRGRCGDDDGCWRAGVAHYVETEPARGARIYLRASPIDVGRPLTTPLEIPPGQVALLVTYEDGTRGFVLPVHRPGVTLELHYDAAPLAQIFSDRQFLGAQGETFLTDAAGLFVTPPRFASGEGYSHPNGARPIQRCLAGSDGEVLDLDYRGVPVVHGYRHVEALGGACIMAHMGQHEAFAPARRLWRKVLLFGSAWSAVLLLLTWFVASLLAQPVVALTEAAERLGRGDFRVDVNPVLASRETRTLARTLRRAASALEQQRREQHELIGILGHDLRNPLNAVAMSAQMLDTALTDPVQKRLVARILSSGRRMARMVADLLDFARSRSAGGIPVQRVPAELREVLQDVIDELQAAHPERSLTLEVHARCRALVDVDRLKQVISNLAGNALQHGPPDRPVTVALRCEGTTAEVSVHNEGTAIPPETVARLFQPFQRGPTSNSSDGLGLGLYIADQIVRAHGGTLDVRSDAGSGTTFTVKLPNATR